MNATVQKVCDSLDELSKAIINGWSDDRTLIESFGWNHPTLNRYDLAKIPLKISNKLKDVQPIEIEDDLLNDLKTIPQKIKLLKSNQLPYFYNGNGMNLIPAFLITMEWVNSLIQPLVDWQIQNDNRILPNKIVKRLNSINAQLNEIIPEKEKLEEQISLINEAIEAAESLPSDLQSLKNARKDVSSISEEIVKLLGKTQENTEKSKVNLDLIIDYEKSSSSLVDKCEEAYRITTTKGLAAAFEQRAKKSSYSMWIWVFVLIGALVGGIIIGSLRFTALSDTLANPNPQWGIIWMQLIVSIMSVAAPVWLAWIATKQIGQRFRLAEDYHFKASVAKAYEGYRKEASRLDSKLENRLFDSALTRLEEAPLRLMDKDNHGSPFHELVNSPQFSKALDLIPELKDKLIEVTHNLTLSNLNRGKKAKLSQIDDDEK